MGLDDDNNELFHPLINRWFQIRVGRPTRIQEKAWPLIASNAHVLVTAPTGSGKTLAAFLWALNQLIRNRWGTGQTRVLYISPLKALNNDVQRNLIRPLTEIRRLFEKHGMPFPEIRVLTRSGDTPSHERRQMIRRPPEILITTPESLHLMISSHGGRSMLGRLRTVILDEIHAVVGSKRGTLLISAVDRLVPLCGEFQRIALSATVKPEGPVAGFVGGFMIDGDKADPRYTPREVKRCRSSRRHQDLIHVRIPHAVMASDSNPSIWDDLADTFKQTIQKNHATIIFTNSRRLCEKLAFLINNADGADQPGPIAYAHHGSLSKELRLEVEQRLKEGDLKAIVATASLELGIDIGSLDHVILVQSPPSISSAVQRIGRSGHGVGEVSRATLIPTHATDCLTAAVLADAVMERDIEPVRPVECPLDVLAQVVVSMTGAQSWHVNVLYGELRASYPFRGLRRQAFDLIVDMLAGRYAATRIPALQPKIAFDRLDNTVTIRKGALLTLYTSGGVIPDRGYFGLRHQETGARIGELDEEFVWEAKIGQTFTLGTQNWRIQRISHNDVFVRPAKPKAMAPPFWRAEDADRDFHLSDKIARFLEVAQNQITDSGFLDQLTSRYCMDGDGARFLLAFLKRQQKKTGCPLPHRHHVVVERMPSGKGGAPVQQVVIHTFWGGRVNRPFALALEAAWEKRHGPAPSVFPTNDAVYLLLPQDQEAADLMTLVSSSDVESLLRERLEGSGVFGARFRECAARALLLPRRHFKRRMPLWLTRQQSQRLLDALGRFPDFPILLETWRTCLQDDFDMAALVQVLQELENGGIAWSEVRTASPSPMALSGSWRQVNQYMYADDRQPGRVKTALSLDLLEQVVFTPELRPAVDAGLVAAFQAKRQRLHPGYAPDNPVELLEWVKERLMLPMADWEQLLERAAMDSGTSSKELVDPIREKLLRLIPGVSGVALIVAAEMAPEIADALTTDKTVLRWVTLDGDPTQIGDISRAHGGTTAQTVTEIMAQWLRFYGPVSADFIQKELSLDKETVSGVLSDLIETRAIISGILIRGLKEERVCDADNFDTLLRMTRRRSAPAIEIRDIRELAMALAHFQGLTRPVDSINSLAACLQPLMCLPLPAALWEAEILPARLTDYNPQWLDRLMQESALMWVGRRRRQIAFCHEGDLDLMMSGHGNHPEETIGKDMSEPDVTCLFPDHRAKYSLSALVGDPPQPAGLVLQQLWDGVWAGKVTNDTMIALRRGIARGGYTAGPSNDWMTAGHGSMARPRRSRRKNHGRLLGGPVGNWHLVATPHPPEGLMEKEELVRDRVRLLLDRYGILFRQLLSRELPVFQWAAIFRSLRLMELSGEVVAGCFFNDIPGLQFVSNRMLRLLREKLPDDSLYWISAQDPASICGLGIDALKGELPRRSAGTHLVYIGSRLAMVSNRKGRVLHIRLPVDHDRLADCFGLFDHLLGRRMDPLHSITVETINGQDAPDSPFIEVLRDRYDTIIDTRTVTVYQRVVP